MPLDAEGIYLYTEAEGATAPTFSAFLNKLGASVSARFAAGRPPRPIMARVKNATADAIGTVLGVQKYETLDFARNVTGKLEYDAATGDFKCLLPGIVRVSATIAHITAPSGTWVNALIQKTTLANGLVANMRIRLGQTAPGAGNSRYIDALVPVAAGDRVRVMRQASSSIVIISTDSTSPATYVTVEYTDVD